MDTRLLLQRILTKPSTADLLTLQGILLSWEDITESPLPADQVSAALAIAEDFYCFLVGLESRLEAHSYAELASKMDMGAVGGVVAATLIGAGERLLEQVLIGGFSEALMVLASRQYVKAFTRELDALYQQVVWQQRAHFWRFSSARCPHLSAAERTRLIDSLFSPLLDPTASGSARSLVHGCLFQILLAGALGQALAAE